MNIHDNRIAASMAGLVLIAALAGCGGASDKTPTTEGLKSESASQSSAPSTTSASTAQTASTPAGSGPGQIVGFVFVDSNRNRTLDGNETRMANVPVSLTNPSATEQIRSATTGSDGGFRFDNLTAGSYRVTFQLPAGFERTTDNSFVVTVAADGTTETRFGIVRP